MKNKTEQIKDIVQNYLTVNKLYQMTNEARMRDIFATCDVNLEYSTFFKQLEFVKKSLMNGLSENTGFYIIFACNAIRDNGTRKISFNSFIADYKRIEQMDNTVNFTALPEIKTMIAALPSGAVAIDHKTGETWNDGEVLGTH